LSRARGPTGGFPQGLDIGELHVAPGADLLPDVPEVVLVVDVVEDLPPFGVDRPQDAVVEIEPAVLADQAQMVRGERGEAVDEILVLGMVAPEELDGRPGPRDHLVDVERRGALEEPVPLLRAEVLVHAAGNGPGAVDLLSGGRQDDLLAELAQEDGPGRQLLVEGDDADDVAHGRVGVHAQEKVRRGEMEEVQGMRLEHLAVVHEPAHLLRRRR
jgi:hypothetical protein